MARLVKRTHTGPYKLARTEDAGRYYWYDAEGQRHEAPEDYSGIRSY